MYLFKMTTRFYGVTLTHGSLSSRHTVKLKHRLYQPDRSKKVVPIFSFGTSGAATGITSTILCFLLFTSIYGTDFCEEVATALTNYGENYMTLYTHNPMNTIQRAVQYLFILNQIDIQTCPQNRFYSFIKREQSPYDFALLCNYNNEQLISNISYPTVELYEYHRNKYVSISDFLPTGVAQNSVDVSGVSQCIDENYKDSYGNPTYPDKSLILNRNFSDFKECTNQQLFLDYLLYHFDYGICKMENIFSNISMGVYGSIYENGNLANNLKLIQKLTGKVYLSQILDYLKKYSDPFGEYECAGLFTFFCKNPDELNVTESSFLDLPAENFESEGLAPRTESDNIFLEQSRFIEQNRQKNRKLVQRARRKNDKK